MIPYVLSSKLNFLWLNRKTVPYQLTLTIMLEMHVGHYKCTFPIADINKGKQVLNQCFPVISITAGFFSYRQYVFYKHANFVSCISISNFDCAISQISKLL